MPALELPRHDAVEVPHPEGAGGREYDARQNERHAPAKQQLGTSHAGSAKIAGQRLEFEFDWWRQ
jgi:hypothetical protein